MRRDPRKRPFIDYPFNQRRQVGWGLLLLLLVLNLGYSIFVNLVVFEREWLTQVAVASQGLLQPGLITYLIKIPLFFALIIVVGQLRPKDLGLRASQLSVGIIVFIFLWLIVQLVGMTAILTESGELTQTPQWRQVDLSRQFGIYMANAANVLFEEVFFRGFLLIQLYLKLGDRASASPSQGRIFVAVVLSQLIFMVDPNVKTTKGQK